MEDQMGFVRKVFGIVAMQMTVTFIFAIGGAVNKKWFRGFETHPWLMLLSFITTIASMFTLVCGTEIRKKVPFNYILLGAFTFGEAMMFAGTTARLDLDVQAVLLAIGVLSITTLSLFYCALKVEHISEFRIFEVLMFALIWHLVFFVSAIVTGLFTSEGLDMMMVLLSIAAIPIVSVYIVIDLCRIIIPGGINKEDYILASLMLYMDIANLFYHILIILGKK